MLYAHHGGRAAFGQGDMGNRAQLSRWQDEFHAHMKKAFPVLKRGESSLVTKRKHIPTWLFKQSVSLVKQQKAIEQAISEITMMNAGKKKEEAIAFEQVLSPDGSPFGAGEEVPGHD